MNNKRLSLLPLLLEKYKDKLDIDVESGTITGLKPYTNHKGYLTLNFWHNGGSRYYRVHEIIAFLCGLDLLDKTVDHIDGNKKNNKADNLQTITREENHKKAKLQGKIRNGDAVPNSKLTWDQVEAIRELAKSSEYSQRKIGEMFSVDQSCVSRVVSRQTYKTKESEAI